MSGNDLRDRLLTPKAAADYLGYEVQTVYNKASKGELPSVKLGYSLRFRLSELDAWIAAQDAAAKETKAEQKGDAA